MWSLVVPVVAALVLGPTTSVGGLKTFCKKSDSSCDATWAPLDNLEASLVGYDLPTGNPYASLFIEDPGLRKQIFNATKLEGDFYQLESGISVREYKMCDEKFTTRVATNLFGYKKIAAESSLTGTGFDVTIEAEDGSSAYEGKLPPLVQIAWHFNDKTQAVKDFFVQSKGAVAITEARCITHKVDISQFLIPGFHPAFIEVLKILESQNTETRQLRAFKKFVRDYGTHYLSSVFMGSKITAQTYFSSYERLKFDKKKVMKCAENAAREALDVKLDDGDEDEKEEDDMCFTEADGNDHPLPHGVEARTLLTEFGMRPDSGSELKKWKDKKQEKPIPIKFELTPIVNLFTSDNLDRHNISSANITKWFLPLYVRYCKVLKMDCGVEQGCGLSDECGFSQNCVRDRQSPKGYTCSESSWADVPNWPTVDKHKPDSSVLIVRSGTSPDTTTTTTREAEGTNITWFRTTDFDRSGSLSRNELIAGHNSDSWYDQRFRLAVEKLINEADMDGNKLIDMHEFVKLHERFPWYTEQLSFVLVNIDNNNYLSREELLEASKVSPDMQLLNFTYKQLENLVDGLLAIGDKDGDRKLSFAEYVEMSDDVFVRNFAPSSLKNIFKG